MLKRPTLLSIAILTAFHISHSSSCEFLTRGCSLAVLGPSRDAIRQAAAIAGSIDYTDRLDDEGGSWWTLGADQEVERHRFFAPTRPPESSRGSDMVETVIGGVK